MLTRSPALSGQSLIDTIAEAVARPQYGYKTPQCVTKYEDDEPVSSDSLPSSQQSQNRDPISSEDDVEMDLTRSRIVKVIDLTDDYAPDLESYFQLLRKRQREAEEHVTTDQEIVEVCRTYANYKSRTAMLPKRQRNKK